MDRRRTQFALGALAGAAATLLVGLLVAVAVAYSGAYDISASSGHTAGMRWLLDTTMHASVRSHADPGHTEARLRRADREAGASAYKAMCEHCHGGPGVEPAEWSRGMLPRPPHMTEAAREWDAAEIAWIVRHGVKYTGMPAFGSNHDEQAIGNIAAFVMDLPAMAPADYRRLGSTERHDHGAPTNPSGGTTDHAH